MQAFAQEDTTGHFQVLKEITVNSKSAELATESTPDLQQLTDKLLSEIPGVTLIKRGNYAQEPTIRGLNNGQINSTIDGMQIFGACTDRMDPISSYVEPNNLSTIEVHTDANEASMGSSIGGGFQFQLMKATLNADRTFSGRLGAGFENNALALQTFGGFQWSRKRFAIQVNSIYRSASNYTDGNGQEVAFSQYEKWNLAGNVAIGLHKNHTLRLDYLQDDGRNIGYPALTMDVSFANAKLAAVSHEYKNLDRKFYQVETKFYYNFIDHAMDDTKRPPEMVPMHMDMPGTSQTFGMYSKGSLRLSKKHLLKVQLNAYQNDLHAEMTMYPDNGAAMFMLTIPDAKRSVGGISVSDKFRLTDRWTFSGGVRLEGISSDITTIMGRQTLSSFYTGDLGKSTVLFNGFVRYSVRIGKQWKLNGGITRAARNATLQEMYGFYLFNRVDAHDYLGNPDLAQETSWNLHLGSVYSRDKITVQGNLFGYFFSDYIAGVQLDGFSHMTIGALGVKQYINLSNALLYGGELVATWKPWEHATFTSATSVSIGLDDEKSPLPFIPPLKSITGFKYHLKGYQFNFNYTFAMAQNLVNTEKYGELPSKAFHVFDAGIGKKFELGKQSLQTSLRVENLFDVAYYEHLDVMKIPRQGRNFVLHLTYLF